VADSQGFADAVLGAVLEALQPLEAVVTDEVVLFDLLADLGWAIPDEQVDLNLLSALAAIASDVTATAAALETYRTAASGQDDEALAGLAESVTGLLADIAALASMPMPTTLPAPLSNPAFWSSLATELPGYLIVGYMRRKQPLLFAVFHLTGIFDKAAPTADPNRIASRTVDVLRWDRLATLLTQPQQLFVDVYGWGGPLKYDALLDRLRAVLTAAGVLTIRSEPGQERIDKQYGTGTVLAAPIPMLRIPLYVGASSDNPYAELGLDIFPIPASTGSAVPVGVAVSPYALAGLTAEIALTDDLALEFFGSLDASGAMGVLLRPGGFAVFFDSAAIATDLGLAFVWAPPAPRALLGDGKGSGITIAGASLRGEVMTAGTTVTDVRLAIGVDKFHVHVEFGEGDSFISKIAAGVKIDAVLDGALIWSLKDGVSFEGSPSLEIAFPLNLALGPLELLTLTLGVGIASGAVRITGAIDASLEIGPVAASIQSVGVAMRLEPEPGGSLAGLSPHFGFKPPTGLGIAIDAGPVGGGGFVSFDADKGRYAGVLQLKLTTISVTAIGILDTKVPGGGWSFLIIIAATFPPIQLGFGFSLIGLGGLAGIARTMVIDALQTGVRSGSVDHILFPEDPVRDAPQILADLQTIFPPAPGRYVFGPMAILGWGTPALIEAQLGIILEVPSPVRLVILGQLSLVVPTKESPVLELHLDVLGVIDFGEGTLAIDAVIHDSRLVVFALSGDLSLRLSWGAEPAFAMAVGGFNPRFQPPRGFPALRRLTLALAADGGNPTVQFQFYFAITSNSAQMGARADLAAAAFGFSVTGWFGFDVLIIFKPLSIVADFTAGVVIKRGSLQVAAINLTASLTGPSPWHIVGEASFDCIVHVRIPIDATLGEAVAQPLPPPVDLWPQLRAELERADNWRADLPPAGELVCSLRSIEGAAPALDPLGGAAVHERVVPLNRRLGKVGDAPAAAPGQFRLEGVTVGGTGSPFTLTQDFFAPGQFEAMNDAAKLSRPAFEKMDAGFAFGASGLAVPSVGRTRTFALETIVVDEPATPGGARSTRTLAASAVSEQRQLAFLGISAAARSPLANSGPARFAPPFASEPVARLDDERFVVVNRDSLARVPGTQPLDSKGAAHEALEQQVAANPAQRGLLIVVPELEAA
jgi:hypothetical protein